jgi:hypothetical protein
MPATGSDASAAAALAMAQYFDGERREMYAIVAGSLVCVGLALCLLLVARDGFAKGLMVVVVISAGLLSPPPAPCWSVMPRCARNCNCTFVPKRLHRPSAASASASPLSSPTTSTTATQPSCWAFWRSLPSWRRNAAGCMVRPPACWSWFWPKWSSHYSKHREQYLEQLTKGASEEPVVLRG